jgi:hypothetical protein
MRILKDKSSFLTPHPNGVERVPIGRQSLIPHKIEVIPLARIVTKPNIDRNTVFGAAILEKP